MRQVHAITSAGRSMSDQQHDRVVRYLWTMGVRTVCFVLAASLHNWWSLLFLAGAVLLPWIAVIWANSGGERQEVPDTYLDTHTLEGPPAPREAPTDRSEDSDGSSDL